jgi:hypothetical protein
MLLLLIFISLWLPSLVVTRNGASKDFFIGTWIATSLTIPENAATTNCIIPEEGATITFVKEDFYLEQPLAMRVTLYSGITRQEYPHFLREDTEIVLPFAPTVSFNQVGYSSPVFLDSEESNLLHYKVGISFDSLQQSAEEMSFFLWFHVYDASIQFFTSCGVKIVFIRS